jgi:hypothetical protein
MQVSQNFARQISTQSAEGIWDVWERRFMALGIIGFAMNECGLNGTA